MKRLRPKTSQVTTPPAGAAHEPCVAARPQRQRKGVEQNRLAGAGLAGQHRHAGLELDRNLVDDGEVAVLQNPAVDDTDDLAVVCREADILVAADSYYNGPAMVVTAEGEWLLCCQDSSTQSGHDGVITQMRSRDRGETWEHLVGKFTKAA